MEHGTCNDNNSLIVINNNELYNTNKNKSKNNIEKRNINHFIIDFNNTYLFRYIRKLVPDSKNTKKYILLLETPLRDINTYIKIPALLSLYKDILGYHCEYSEDNKLIYYLPRLNFKYYYNSKLKYCTYDDSKYHKAFYENPDLINLVKMRTEIITEKYKSSKKIFKEILSHIIKLFDINGKYSFIIAKFLVFYLNQESYPIIMPMYSKLFNYNYNISNPISITVHKKNTKYYIKHVAKVNSPPIENYIPPPLDDRLTITYILDEKNPVVYIKLEMHDIDDILKTGLPVYNKDDNRIQFVIY
jgi:hypothetical protein